MFALKAKKMITPLRSVEDAVLVIDGEKILSAGAALNVSIPEGIQVIDLGDRTLCPGFIDIHHHGAVGARASGGVEAVQKIGRFLPSTGCTSWLPTVNAKEHCVEIVKVMKAGGTGGADIPGIHMEGPFLAPKALAGRPEVDAHLLRPDVGALHAIQEAAEGHVLLMGFGIEMPGSFDVIREAGRIGILASVAHTKGDYELFMKAVDAGIRHATHIYNVMTKMHHRKPGIVGAILTCDEITGELIGDGLHVHPAALDVAIRCKGVDKVALITDQSELAGLPDGRYMRPNGVAVIKKDGVCRMEGFDESVDNTMAGSSLTMDFDLRTLVNRVGLSLADAVKMASLTPARIVRIDKSKGSLEPGKDADVTVLNPDITVHATYVKGERRFLAR